METKQLKTIYQKNVKFIDDTNTPVYLEISIKGYFAISGIRQGSSGQILDSIQPANSNQKKLIDLWKAYHLKNIKELPADELISELDQATIHMEKFDGSPYHKIGNEFIEKHGIKFTTEFIKYGRHFEGDRDLRDVFKVKFSRGVKSFSLKFGQSIVNTTGSGGNPPKAYDVLACLTKYDPGSFENFVDEYGYQEDSRNAKKAWKAIVKEWEKVSKFFTEEELSELSDIS